jgi:hypothetical protein
MCTPSRNLHHSERRIERTSRPYCSYFSWCSRLPIWAADVPRHFFRVLHGSSANIFDFPCFVVFCSACISNTIAAAFHCVVLRLNRGADRGEVATNLSVR